MAVTNPLRLVHSAIWTMLEAESTFTSLVPTGNRIKYSGTAERAPDKDTLSGADVPEVRVLDTGFRPHLQQTSSSSSLTIEVQIQVTSGNQEFSTLLDVQWAIYRAMKDWATHLKDTIQWASKNCVTLCRPLAVRSTLGNKTMDRGLKGWSAVWAGEIQLDFTTSDL
jgi:hypothetical protein